MPLAHDVVSRLAVLLRTHRKARGMTVVSLAAAVGVSPRLVSEFERGKRPHVSLETAMRLLERVGAPVFSAPAALGDEMADRVERAARRRQTWRGTYTTLSAQSNPDPPPRSAERLIAVASASQLVAEIRAGYERQVRTPTRGKKRTG